MDKKAAELSLNVIIIAVIVIIVLVVLIIIFSTRTNIFTRSTHEASAPFGTSICDVPGTGRYCSSSCFTDTGDYDTGMKSGEFTCRNTDRGADKCCCCKFELPPAAPSST